MVGIALLVAGCSTMPFLIPSPAPLVEVPGPAPDAPPSLVEQRMMTVVRRPISQVGVEIGRDYLYEMGHCGLDMPIDVDGSFWLPVGNPNEGRFEMVEGIWRLRDHWLATFTTPSGWSVDLRRQPGNLEFRPCA
jgi:hypothetical protein